MSEGQYSIEVTAESIYVDAESEPDENRYLFAYRIVIRNAGRVGAQLRTRHWIITDGNGLVREVRGDGVVGEQPYLAPGEAFSYTSAAMLDTPIGSMHGTYQMVAEDGVEFDAEIPTFGLAIPNIKH